MTITFEQAAWGIGIIGSLVGWSWWVVSRVTKSETEIKASVERLAAEAKSSIASLERATQDRANTQMDAVRAMHTINEAKMDRLTDRIIRVETIVGGITKVVVFQEGQAP